jgi:hypothetical protein
MAGHDPDFVNYQTQRGAWKTKRYQALYQIVLHFTKQYVGTNAGERLKAKDFSLSDERQLFEPEEAPDKQERWPSVDQQSDKSQHFFSP